VTLKFAPFLLAAAALAYACGPRPPAADSQAQKGSKTPRTLASSLDVDVGQEVAFAFHLTNGQPKSVELNFPSGQTHDFAVIDTVGREIWRWSRDRVFTQAMQNYVLGRDETLSYSTRWEPGEHHGDFIAVVTLLSANHPLEQRVRFSLP
jgi:hypothetical protein